MHPPPEWLRLIGSQLWQVTLLIPVLIVVIRATCRKRSHLAYGLLLVALVKCITPPVFTSPVGVFGWMEGRQRTLRQRPAALPQRESAPVIAAAGQQGQPPTGTKVEPSPTRPATDAANPAIESMSTIDTVREAASPPPVAPPPGALSRLLEYAARHGWIIAAAVWGLGMAAWGVWLLVSLCRLGGLFRLAEDAPGDLAALGERLSQQLGLRRTPELMITDDASMPVAAGVRHRRVLLPRYILESATDDELELILAHELNHFRRWDTAVGLLQAVTHVVWWFHPCVWWLNRELRRYREQCCDEEVLARLNCRPQQYARCLLNVLELNERCSPALGLAGMSPFEVTSRRLRNIMRAPGTFRAHTPAWCWALLLCVGIVVLPGASTPVQQGLEDEGVAVARDTVPPTGRGGSNDTDIDEPAPELPAAAVTSLPRELRYNWRPGTSFPYRINIEVDHNDEVETISGTPSFHVRSAVDGQAELIVTGDRLMSVRLPRPGRIRDLSMPRIPRFPRVDFPTPGLPTEHTVRLDARGRVISEQGESEPLPYLLGHLPSFLFEPLPETLRDEWRQTRMSEIRLGADDADESPFPIRRTNPFRPFAEPQPELLSAEETATCRIERLDAGHIVLHKDYTLATVQTVDGEPRVRFTGQVQMKFDTERGIPTSIRCDARMTQRDGNVTTTWPIRATADLVQPASTPAGDGASTTLEPARPDYAGPGSVPSSGLVVTDDTALVPRQIVQVQWGGGWYPADILAAEADGRFQVHYRGWSDQSDESVPRARIQLAHPESERR
jgi:beta-lactamase regulating signal transducer with metallopeptidase domain